MKKSIKSKLFILTLVLFSIKSIYAQTTTEDVVHLSRIDEGLKAPVRMAIDRQDNVYVTDANAKLILKYDASGNLLETYDPNCIPLSLALNREDQLFFGDGVTGTIYRLESNGSKTEFYSGILYPNSMVFDADGLLYVVDSYRKEVVVLDLSANVVRTIGEGTFLYPTGIAFNPNNNRLLVAEHGGLDGVFSPTVKVWMFDMDGTLVSSFGRHGNTDGRFYRIQGMAAGKCGNIYVSDPYLGRISIFDENGVFITLFGEWGDAAGQLNVPLDITFNSQDQILVSSMNNGAIEVYGITSTLPSSKIESFNTSICQDETVDIEIALTGTAPWTFSYTVDGLNPVEVSDIYEIENPYILTVSEPGTYEVSALSDANNAGTCFTGKTAIRVNTEPPTANLSSGDVSICEGESTDVIIDFTGLPPWTFSYIKDGTNPITITTTNNPYTLNVSEAGLYEISALKGGGCLGSSFTGSALITVNELPTSHFTDDDIRIPLCQGETTELRLELTGAAPWSFTYMVDDSNPVTVNGVYDSQYLLQTSDPGTYEIKLLVDQNCSNIHPAGYPDYTGSPEVITNGLPSSEITSPDVTICEGETAPVIINFTGTAPWTFTYKVGTLMTTTIYNTYTNPYIINASYTGIYEVIAISDANYSSTCISGSAEINVNPLPAPIFLYNKDGLEVSFLNNSLNADYYYWDFGDGTVSTETDPIHLYPAAGDYTVSLRAVNDNCGENTVIETISISDTPIDDIDPYDIVKMYPNPSGGLVTFEINNPYLSEIRIDIISVSGLVIYTNIFYSHNVTEQIDLSSFKKGMYIVKISSSEFIDTRKLILTNKTQNFSFDY